MPAEFTPDSYPLILASNILSGGESSRLYRKLVYEDQIAMQTAAPAISPNSPTCSTHSPFSIPAAAWQRGEGAADDPRKHEDRPVDPKELEKAGISQFRLHPRP